MPVGQVQFQGRLSTDNLGDLVRAVQGGVERAGHRVGSVYNESVDVEGAEGVPCRRAPKTLVSCR